MAGYMFGGAIVGGVAGGFSAGAGIAASAGTTGIQAAMSAGMVGGMTAGAINGAGMTALAGGGFDDILGGMVQGAIVGGFSGLAGGAAFQGMTNILPKLVPKGIFTRLVFGNFPMHNTISYLTGASASTMTANIIMGKKIFENMDNIIKSPAILLPVFADFSSIIPSIPKKIATNFYKNNPKIKVNKSMLFPFARTRLQNNGDLTILSYLTGNNPEGFYNHTYWMQESLFISNYRPLIISLFLNKTFNKK